MKESLLHKLYWRMRTMASKLIGTAVEENRWRNRKDVSGDILNLNHSHRDFLIKEIGKFAPFKNVLEIGCGYGPNLILLSKLFPKAKFKGIDINPNSIKLGKEYILKNNIKNVELSCLKADDISGKFDVVFTDAVLMYIGPDKIEKVIKKINTKRMAFLEHHSFDESALGRYNQGNWIRDYSKLLPGAKCIKLPRGLWKGDWEKFGYLIKI